jgi:hypothetical protein
MGTRACRVFGQNSVDEVERLFLVFHNGRPSAQAAWYLDPTQHIGATTPMSIL